MQATWTVLLEKTESVMVLKRLDESAQPAKIGELVMACKLMGTICMHCRIRFFWHHCHADGIMKYLMDS